MKTEVKINIVSVLLILALIFLMGYLLNTGRQSGKEFRALKADIKLHKHKVDSLTGEVIRYQSAMDRLGMVLTGSTAEISEKDKRIAFLKKQLREVSKTDTIPSSEKYDILMIHTGFDSLPKPYAFSARQIDTIYRDNEMLSLALAAVDVYGDYVTVLSENLEGMQMFSAIQDSIISTQEKKVTEKDQIIADKDKQLQLSKKGGNRAKILNWVIGGVATMVTYIAITK